MVDGPRIIRSPWSDFYGREIEDALKTHPESYLEEAASEGFNGIWLHSTLRDIVSSTPFPEFGKKGKEQMPALNRLVERAAKYGMKVFLYLCEPRGFDGKDTFWKKNGDVKGQPLVSPVFNYSHFALCSTTQRVKDFLALSSYNLFREAPGLGGVFMITASEFHTHCYSHYPKWQKTFTDTNMARWAEADFYCRRCETRHPSEVVAEIITLVNSGIKAASAEAKVIAWNWSWYIIEPDPQKKLVSLLPRDVILMADFERGGSKKVLGKKVLVDEYSFSYTGPSKRFKDILAQAKNRGMKSMAKIQLGTTHEFVTIPYIPVPQILARKMGKMKKLGVYGYLGCWIFGGDITPMSKIAGKMSRGKDVSVSEAVKETAVEEFEDKKAAGHVVRAWKSFSKAWALYPFSIPFLYYSPVNYSTVYPFSLNARKTGPIPSWRPLPADGQGRLAVGENIETWTAPFTGAFVKKALRQLLLEWKRGLDILRDGAKRPGKVSGRYLKELDMAEHVFLSFESIIDIIDFYRLLSLYRQEEKDGKAGKALKKLFLKQLSLALRDRIIVARNSDFGFHPEAHARFVTVEGLDYKIALLRKNLRILEAARHRPGVKPGRQKGKEI